MHVLFKRLLYKNRPRYLRPYKDKVFQLKIKGKNKDACIK